MCISFLNVEAKYIGSNTAYFATSSTRIEETHFGKEAFDLQDEW